MDLWRYLNQLPTTGGSPKAQDGIWAGFEYLQRKILQNPSEQPVPVLCHP